ncbi:MAG: hypothetical protein H6673_09340 [Anaerolineales bacterium]|nr:hypothetical protein [Anaerolineales bacterium]
MSDTTLKQAVEALKNGQRDEGIRLLKQYIKQNPEDARAWWALANVVTDKEFQIKSLQRVLKLDPAHAKAKQMLDKLQHTPQQPDWLTADVEEPDPFPSAVPSTPPPPPVDTLFEPVAKKTTPPLQPFKFETREQAAVPQKANSNTPLLILLGVAVAAVVLLALGWLLFTLLGRDLGGANGPKLTQTATSKTTSIQYPDGWQATVTQYDTIIVSTKAISTGDINPWGTITDLEYRRYPDIILSRLEYWTKYYWDFLFTGGTDDFANLFMQGMTDSYGTQEDDYDKWLVATLQTVPGRSRRTYDAEQAVIWLGQLFDGELQYSIFGIHQTVDIEKSDLQIGGLPGHFTRITISSGYSGIFGGEDSYSSLYFATVANGDVDYLFLLSAFEEKAGYWEKFAREMAGSIQIIS